jgi:uridine kinase
MRHSARHERRSCFIGDIKEEVNDFWTYKVFVVIINDFLAILSYYHYNWNIDFSQTYLFLMKTFTYGQLDQVIEAIMAANKKIIYLAGATASGKSYIADQLTKTLGAMNKKVLMISADHYYRPDSAVQSMIYGTYDHPNLIDHDLINENLQQLLSSGSFDMPEYSFVEKTRLKSQPIAGSFDYIIIEWLYVINELSEQFDPLKIFVHSQAEDLIIRRLIRDPERTKEPLYIVANTLTKVFPMWIIAGKWQMEKSDIVINNTYEILNDRWVSYEYRQTSIFPKSELKKTEYVINYFYNDTHTDNDGIVISEVYHEQHGYLHEVKISKVQSNDDGTKEWLTLSVMMPGILVEMHTLIQLAGCSYLGKQWHKQYKYEDGTLIHQQDTGELYLVKKK